MNSVRVCLILFFCSAHYGYALRLVDGDVTDGSATMSFTLGNLLTDSFSSTLFVASGAAPATENAKQYALSLMYADQSQVPFSTLLPLTPQTVVLNGAEDSVNPLYGQSIGQSAMYQYFPAVTISGGATVYWVAGQVGATKIAVYTSTAPLKDASNAANCSSVAGLVGMSSSILVAAVAPNAGVFGNNNSGLTLLRYNDEKKVLDTVGTTITLDPTSPVLLAGTAGPLAAMGQNISLYYDSTLGRMYAGLNVTAPGGGKAIAVCAGYLNADGNALTLEPIAGNNAIQSNTVVGAGGGETAFIPLVKTMHTSTGLDYLVVAYGLSIYVLPLVNLHANPANQTWQTDPTQGALAKKYTSPTNYYQDHLGFVPYEYFNSRGFEVPATVAGDLYDTTVAPELAIIQAGGSALSGAIQSIQVYRDTVFSTIAEGASNRSGVFYSQALFDTNGVIIGWTSWQRVVIGTTNQAVTSTVYIPSFDALYTVQNGTSLYFNTWSTGSNDGLLGGTTTSAAVGLIDTMDSFFGSDGVQGIFDFPKEMIVFNQAAVNNAESYQVYTGNGQCAIARTLSGAGGYYVPAVGAFTVTAAADTAITFPGVSGITTITGSTIKNMGALTASMIVGSQVAETRFLFLGGSNGLAYANITAGGALTVLPGFAYVRKLWVDENILSNNVPYLYVLTNSALYRLTYNGATFDQTTLVTIASLGLMPQATFSDVTIVNNYAFLATSLGLYQALGNVGTATGITSLTWQKIILPNNVQAATRLSLFSTTTNGTDYRAQTNGGNLYVLCADVPKSRAAIYRYAVNGTNLQLIPDTFHTIKNAINPYMYFTEYRNYYCANDALNFSMAPQNLSTFSFIQTTDQSGQIRPATVPFGISDGDTMGNLVRSSALGSMMIYGNFGVCVHE